MQEFRETDSDRLWGEKWQRALWKFMVERDATVKLSDIERWVKTYKPNYNVRNFFYKCMSTIFVSKASDVAFPLCLRVLIRCFIRGKR